MYTKKDFHVGKKLYYTPFYTISRGVRTVEIAKVGNKLIHCKNGAKIFIETLREKSNYTQTQYYISKEKIEEESQAQENYRAIQSKLRKMSYHALTHQQIHDLYVAINKIIGDK